jgi:2-polyprenyl-3-methyl-5-hydroxy-6-metoxy-1,4-benzoquinol methylase
MFSLESFVSSPHLRKIIAAQLSVWPEHAKYLIARFAEDSADFRARSDEIAKLVLSLVDDRLCEVCADYRWMCENFLDEELYFRRHKRYRLATFEEANNKVYSNTEYMSRYVNGILLSQLFWHNHAVAMDLFRTRFLPSLPKDFQHVEVGPGHGLFLAQAATHPNCGNVTGWDISPASIAATREALRKFGIAGPVNLVQQDIVNARPETARFDSAVISEVLEHLERPDIALKTLFDSLRAGGRLFVNMPANSPAPDHIYLCRSASEVANLIKAAGFAIYEMHELPMTGYSVERARRTNSSISCVAFGRRP